MRNVLLQLGTGLTLLGSAFAGVIQGRVSSTGSTVFNDAIVSVEDIDARFPPSSKPAVMDQRGLRFVPHVLAIQAGTTVEFPNSDPLAHNVFSISDVKRFNLGLYPKGVVRRLRFDEPGIVQLLCNVHLEMSGFIVVVKNPYFTRVNPDGTYRIDGVPAGRHRVRCWHESRGPVEQTVDVPADGTARRDFRLQ